MSTRGVLHAAQHDRSVLIQAEGTLTMAHAPALRRFAQDGLSDGCVTLEVDLGRCQYIDSTVLGTLVVLKRMFERPDEGRFSLVAPSPECSKLLHQMSMDGFFPIVAAASFTPAQWRELAAEGQDRDQVRPALVEAHQELANLEGPASEPFREVARRLAEEMSTPRAR